VHASAKSDPADTKKPAALSVVFLGDSITAGYGLKKKEAYPSVLASLADKDGTPLKVINAGLSGDTTSGGLRRIKVLARKPIDVLVIALGGNDGLRGISPSVSRANLEAIIDLARKARPGVRVLLAGMEMPGNMGEKYTEEFASIYGEVAKEKSVSLLPFLIEGVAKDKTLNQADQIHPNAEGQKKIALHVYGALKKLLAASP
jgi:acyl-CoA thioesterase-1